MYQITNIVLVRFLILFTSFPAFRNVFVAADPNIISKSQWNGVEAVNELTRQSLPVGRVIILHTAGVECQNADSCSQQVRNIQNYHLRSLHFDDIAYNFLIGNDGSIYEGRGWEFVSAAVKNYNVGSLSVAFIGTFESSTPSTEALEAAQALFDTGVRTGKLTEDYKLFGHRQLSTTSSPGATLYEIIKRWPHWSRTVS
ncbi:PREDICTED: peptidoglycan-recognition protein SD-like [Rhagoletis zephyria]|uniref:peptidoglycan-recognition protein SD-like n=1 Tax=Rhagoletis zephyria TaxID=28612 RepID=UPI0008112FE4|nr:PREDICTED: peptidoglycan-recognition protein SD-like [Rhagoletis zephyria]